jgi:hypothetical protein
MDALECVEYWLMNALECVEYWLRPIANLGEMMSAGSKAARGVTIHRKVVNFSFSLATDALD